MIFQFQYQQQILHFDTNVPIDISIPLKAGAENVNCYYANPVEYQTIRAGSFVGDTRLGGSCNYQEIRLTPHGNGTHTECYGHISTDGATIYEQLKRSFFVARLVSLPLTILANGDEVVSLADLVREVGEDLPEALIIRTLPNDEAKVLRQYSGTNPPYLEASIGTWLREQGVQHLLVDLPSLDRESDEGRLLAHRNFWNYPEGNPHHAEALANVRKTATITELIYAPPMVADGLYVLNLQVISLLSDASPSKPILYALYED